MYWATQRQLLCSIYEEHFLSKISNKNSACICGGEKSQMLVSNDFLLPVGNRPMSFKFKYPQLTNKTSKIHK
jgi:hypothetical protein